MGSTRDSRPDGSIGEAPELMIDGLRALAAEKPLTLQVSGQCMEPVISDRTSVVISPRNRYWPGDVLAFRSRDGDLRVHRLIGFRWRDGRLLLQTRADAGGTLDEPFPKRRVIGKVIGAPAALRPTMVERLRSVAQFLRLHLSGALRG